MKFFCFENFDEKNFEKIYKRAKKNLMKNEIPLEIFNSSRFP